MVRDTTATRLTLGALLVTALSLATIDSHSGATDSPLHPVRSAAATVLSPMQAGLDVLTRPFTGTVNALDEAHTRSGLVDELTAENAALQVELRDALGRAADANAFTDLMATARASGTALKLGHVIAVNATGGYSWTIAIGLGSADGIAVDSAVIDAAGLVGRVISVSPHVATVLLAADPLSTVGVRMAGSREVGTLEGTGDDLLRLTLFNRNARMQPGDDLLTFGSPAGRPYAADIPVGQVVSVTSRGGGLGQIATVRPYARFTALDVIGVIGVVVAAVPVQARPPADGLKR